MSKFGKKAKTTQNIPTSALPDIIFMLLFFFMVTTVMRESTLLVENKLPAASQVQKLEKEKKFVSYLYIGKPRDAAMGKESIIQWNDRLVYPDVVPQFVESEREKLKEDREKLIVSLKVDNMVKMGIVNDVKQKLRDVNALRINYSAVKGEIR
jgi:biopolymer transport protein ExbD